METEHEPPPALRATSPASQGRIQDAIGSSPVYGGGGPPKAVEGAPRIVAIARSWIGTPYIHQASVKHAGCDCLGLLRGIWRELHGEEPQAIPPYSEDWSELSGEETLRNAFAIHMREIEKTTIAPGDIAIFRMSPHAPAKHCGVIASSPVTSPEVGRSERVSVPGGGLTLIHARQNKRVSEEPFSPFWRRKLAYAFRP